MPLRSLLIRLLRRWRRCWKRGELPAYTINSENSDAQTGGTEYVDGKRKTGNRRASENAEKNGAMHGRIFTSTPQLRVA